MLRIFGSSRDNSLVNRRSFLQAGMLGVGGLGLADLMRMCAQSSEPLKDTNIILIWMSGGPGHMETYDPKPDAVEQYRGPFGAIPTNVPGVIFGELLPEQAKIMDKITVVRTVKHGTGDHTKANHWMLTGYPGPDFNAKDLKQLRPSIGSAVAKLRGPNRPGMPAYAAVPHLRGGTDNFYHYASYIGVANNPFNVDSDPNLPQFRVRNLALSKDMTVDRLEDRKQIADALDQIRRVHDSRSFDLDVHSRKAFDLLTNHDIAGAFNISAEPDRIRDRYGRHIFGQSALLARRLVEAGVTFVTVNTEPWDHHGTGKQLTTEAGARKLISPVDRAIAALVEDLIARGMDKKTLVVAMGEFGRTPRMNADKGRDHWGHTFSVVFAGGAMNMGQVIGKSTPRGEHVLDRPVTPLDVSQTILHHLGIDGQTVYFEDAQSRPTALVEHGEVIRELVG